MAEVTTPEKPVEPRISRRGFLKLVGIGAGAAVLDGFLAHIPGAPSLSKEFWEQLETATLGVPTEKLKKEIEDKFQIELVSPATGINEVEYNNEKKYPTIEWDSSRLKSLLHVLSELPTHFYSPRNINNEEHKIRFALTDVPSREIGSSREGKYQGGFCACYAAETQLVVLDRKHLESGRGREVWFHEITHALTSPEIERFVENIVKPIGIEELPELRKSFASEIEILTEGEFDLHKVVDFTEEDIKSGSVEIEPTRPYYLEANEIAVIDRRKIESHYAVIQVAPGWYVQNGRFRELGEEYFQKQYQRLQEELYKFEGEVKEKSALGYGAKNFHEFFSVAAEYYSRGRDEFVRTYEPFLGQERAEKLYEGMKRGIFQDKEY